MTWTRAAVEVEGGGTRSVIVYPDVRGGTSKRQDASIWPRVTRRLAHLSRDNSAPTEEYVHPMPVVDAVGPDQALAVLTHGTHAPALRLLPTLNLTQIAANQIRPWHQRTAEVTPLEPGARCWDLERVTADGPGVRVFVHHFRVRWGQPLVNDILRRRGSRSL